MKTNMRYVTTLLVATAATGVAIGLAPVAIADAGTASAPQATGQGDAGPGLWNGGDPAGGTGADSGPDTATGPGFWSGGESAGAV